MWTIEARNLFCQSKLLRHQVDYKFVPDGYMVPVDSTNHIPETQRDQIRDRNKIQMSNLVGLTWSIFTM